PSRAGHDCPRRCCRRAAAGADGRLHADVGGNGVALTAAPALPSSWLPSMRASTLFWTIAGLAALFAAGYAWQLRWSCDDAYISSRYAQHLVEGHGLRFNLDPREPPVEGYTNFLWTLWLALGMALGCVRDAVETFASVSGSLLHGATVLLLAAAARRATGGRA